MTKDELIRLIDLIKSSNCAHLSNSRILYPETVRQSGEQALPIIAINHPLFDAQILLQGAQLIHFAPKGDQSWLWLSPLAEFQQGKAVRGGIPVCFPWFGINTQDATQPKHGFVRQNEWRLESLSTNTHAVECIFSYHYLGDYSELFAESFKAEIKFTLSDHINMQFCFTNISNKPVEFSYALHSYFRVDGIDKTRVKGLDNMSYLDNTDNLSRKSQQGDILFNNEIDRLFPSSGHEQHILSNSPLSIVSKDSPSCIVWNPGKKLASQISDIKNHYSEFVCVERGAAAEQVIALEANEEKHTTMDILKRIKTD